MGPFLSPADAAERTHDNAFNRANVCAAMLLASLLVPLAVVAIVFLIQRLRIPAFLAIMATVVVYGIAADMTFMSVGKAFGLGFTAALEQAGLLVVAGSLVGALVLRQPLGTGTSAIALPAASGARRWAMKSFCQSPSLFPKAAVVPESTRLARLPGWRAANSCAIMPPSEWPTR